MVILVSHLLQRVNILFWSIQRGRHKSYSKCTEDEKEFYADELDEAIHWDALAAAYDDF